MLSASDDLRLSRKRRNLFTDQDPSGETIRADTCLVGGGPAGIALALRLARNRDLRVLLLESGGLAFEEGTQDLARAEMVGANYFPLHETRIRALGGSTWSWGGVCTPLDATAFEPRPWVPNSGWPIGATEMRPYLDDALELCQVTLATRRTADEAAGAPYDTAGLDRHRVVPVPVYFSRPTRFGSAYRAELAALPNVTVRPHSTVTGLQFARGRIVGVDASWRRSPFRVEAGSYVLACGGIENARLLLVSGLGGPAAGRFFMEHPRVVDRFRVRPGDTPLARLVGDGIGRGLRFLRLAVADAVQREEQLLGSHANLQFAYAGQEGEPWAAMRRLLIAARSPWNESPYYQDAGGGRLRARSADVLSVLRRPDRAFLGTIGAITGFPPLRRHLEMTTAVEQLPVADNRIELTHERDAVGVPRVRIHWGASAAEERTYRRSRELLLHELEKLEPGIASEAVGGLDPWGARIVGNWHHEGTTRMSDDPALGSVDRNCRVHDVSNLYVAGSSVFPTSGSTSPTVAILQLALRLADRLASLDVDGSK
jgi:choline dehydrogenase-like flavoprotein